MLEIEKFSLQFPGEKTLLAEDFKFSKEKIIAFCGPSGSGKTIMAKSLLGILPPGFLLAKETKIRFQGEDLRSLDSEKMRDFRWNHVAWIDQDPNVFFNPVITLREHVIDKSESVDFFIDILSYLGLEKKILDLYPHELSGGMKQRAMIAYSLVRSPSLIIADEPSTALDKESKQDLIALLKKIQKRFKVFLVFITHEIDLAWQIADKIILFDNCHLYIDDKTDTSQARLLREKFFREYEQLMSGKQRANYSNSEEFLAAMEQYQKPHLVKKTQFLDDLKDKTFYFISEQSSLFIKQNLFSKKKILLDSIVAYIEMQKITMIIGPSGAGKSSFLQMFLHPHRLSGTYHFPFGQKKTSMLFQNPAMSLNNQLTIYDNLIDALDNSGISLKQKKIRIVDALEGIGFTESDLLKYPQAFSGGQLQRLALIRALLYDPEILLLDEPTSSLDLISQNQLIDLIVSLQKKKKLTLIWVTHEKALLARFAHNILMIKDGICSKYILASK